MTDLEWRNAKPREKPYKLSDERGLFLLVNPNDSKWWRLRYTWQGGDQLLSLGIYPEVPLAGRKLSTGERAAGKPDRIKGARELGDEARELLASGVLPRCPVAISSVNNPTVQTKTSAGRETAPYRSTRAQAFLVPRIGTLSGRG